MSELLAAAAAALKAPETIVQRSAEARAKATGASVDEILAAWAGGVATPSSTQTSVPSTQTEPSAAAARSEEPEEPEAPEPEAGDRRPEAEPRTEDRGLRTEEPVVRPPTSVISPPILVGARQSQAGIIWGSLGLLLLSLLLGFLLPSLAGVGNQVRSSALPHTRAGLEGLRVYQSEGCGSCHTQMIRPVVGDFQLGPVTLADSNQVLGYRRLGPDLSAVGGRLDEAQIRSLLAGAGSRHPPTPISDAALDNLVAYLLESR